MGKIVAIGGGEIGGVYQGKKLPIETLPIDRHIVSLTQKKNPRFLFVPTASNDSEIYSKVICELYKEKLGCITDVLLISKEKPSKEAIRKKISWADIIYVGGGNTLKMMNRWKFLGVDKELIRAYKEGKVLCGLSAGANCWFRQCSSDSRKFYGKNTLIKVSGLNFIDALVCPHYNTEKDRAPSLKKMMKRTRGIAIALDECAAIEIKGNIARVITSKKSAKVYKAFWKNGVYVHKELTSSKEIPIKELITKG